MASLIEQIGEQEERGQAKYCSWCATLRFSSTGCTSNAGRPFRAPTNKPWRLYEKSSKATPRVTSGLTPSGVTVPSTTFASAKRRYTEAAELLTVLCDVDAALLLLGSTPSVS